MVLLPLTALGVILLVFLKKRERQVSLALIAAGVASAVASVLSGNYPASIMYTPTAHQRWGFFLMIASVGPLLVPGRSKNTRMSSRRLAELGDLDEAGGDCCADRGDQPGHDVLALGPACGTVDRDHALVDTPGSFDLDVAVIGEQCFHTPLLLVGQQISAGVQGPPALVERVVLTPAGAMERELDPTPTHVHGVTGQTNHVEGTHNRGRGGDLLGGCRFEDRNAPRDRHEHGDATRVRSWRHTCALPAHR